MNSDDVREAILTLEKALENGLLDSASIKNINKKISKKNKVMSTTSSSVKSSSLVQSTQSGSSKSTELTQSSSKSTELTQSSSKSTELTQSTKSDLSNQSTESTQSESTVDSDLLTMTYGLVPSDFFIQSNNASDGVSSDSHYNLAMSNKIKESENCGDTDEIINFK